MGDTIRDILIILGTYYGIANSLYTILLYFSIKLIKKRKSEFYSHNKSIASSEFPSVTVIDPAFNEEKIISTSINFLINISYPNLNIIIINDGSTDETLNILINNFSLIKKRTHIKNKFNLTLYKSKKFTSLTVIDQKNTGKAQALNNAIAFSKCNFICTVDADSLLEPNSISMAMHEFSINNKNLKAVSGAIRILNGCKTQNNIIKQATLPRNTLALFQIIEYIRSFFGSRFGFEALGGTGLLPGAFTIFRRESLIDVNGFDPKSITEDFEIIVRMKEYYINKNQEAFFHMIPAPTCWTLAPEKITDLYHQRIRWQVGLCETLIVHRNLIFSPKAGRLGLFTLPYLLLYEALGPMVDLFIIIAVSIGIITSSIPINVIFAIAFMGISYGILLTLICIRTEELNYSKHDPRKSRLKFVIFSILEIFSYRQFITITRIIGTIKSIISFNKNKWGKHSRNSDEYIHNNAA